MKESKELIKELVLSYIKEKPTRISLRLEWDKRKSLISIKGKNIDESIAYAEVDFTSFAHGVLEAYREVYGELRVIPISFREEAYQNEKVSLDLYPTGT